MIKALHFLETTITRLVNGALILLFGVMMSLAVIQVFLRYFFNSSILWGDVTARNLVIWVGILGAILATGENKHFHVDVLSRFMNTRYQSWLQSITNLFAAVVCFFLGQAGITFLAFLNIPVVSVEIIAPIGFYLMMLLFAIRSVNNIIEAVHAPSTQRKEVR